MSSTNNTPIEPTRVDMPPRNKKERVRDAATKTVRFVKENPFDTALFVGTGVMLAYGFKIGHEAKADRKAHKDCLDAPKAMLEELAMFPDLMNVYKVPGIGEFKLTYVIPQS